MVVQTIRANRGLRGSTALGYPAPGFQALHDRKVGAQLMFGAQHKEPAVQSRLRSFFDRFMRANAVIVLSSGLCLTASGVMSLMPGAAQTSQPNTKPHQAEVQKLPPRTEAQKTETLFQQIQKLIAELGWKLTGLTIFTTGLTAAYTGYRNKQECMMWGGVGSAMTAPFLAMDPTLLAKAMYFATYAMRTIGTGNMLHNRYSLKPGEKPRETDLQAIFDAKTLKEMVPDAKRRHLLARWLKEVGQSFKAVITNHGLMLKNSALAIYDAGSYIASHPRDTTAKTLKAVVETGMLLARKQDYAPNIPKPNAKQNHLAASLIYLCSLPVLMLSGTAEQIIGYLSILSGMGVALNQFSLFSAGAQDKNLAQRAMVYGVPLVIGGNMSPYTDLGMGTALVGSATVQLAMRKWAQEGSQGSVQTASNPTTVDPGGKQEHLPKAGRRLNLLKQRSKKPD